MIDLAGIISISGQQGLFKIVAQSKNGIIVEGLADKKRLNVYASTKVSQIVSNIVILYNIVKPL
jgi:5S rRNA maturation endonuclease (ribonuclease M5)